MKCLIIAAGKGSRLWHKGKSKPLIPVLGIPLIERVIRSVTASGIDDFYIVIGYKGEQVRTFLDALSKRLGINVTFIINNEWEKENGYSVLKAKGYINEPFLLLMADHLFDPVNVNKLIKYPLDDGDIVIGTDKNVHNPLVDLQDVTRVYTENGKIRKIGKGLTSYNGFDTGIFLCTPAIFNAIERRLSEFNDTTLSGAIQLLAAHGNANDHKIVPESRLFNQEDSIDNSMLDSFFDDDFFRSKKSPFEEMEKIRERMMRQFESHSGDSKGGIFDSWFKKKFGGGNPGEIKQREDDDFVYYDITIKDLVNQKLDIQVQDGQITISGTIEKKSSDKEDKENSRQYFSSTFHRSFPVPYGVDDTKVQIDQDGEKVIIKLPKIK
ncbi:MAG: Hsp20/alpha crystallin family protein [Candidatus Scalindua rubra]|uniref:Hsp20/alpha crystallin family protein n=1 Tax=Candidatus Scalindua rubra TaxID=1872076 RepID=A0A1E3XBK2_9BACT|nr:MAG: Hsp20/alpha crystallin family protein [Candidatus Scalindua rubra]